MTSFLHTKRFQSNKTSCCCLLLGFIALLFAQFSYSLPALAQSTCQILYAGSGEGTGPASDLFIGDIDGTISRRITFDASGFRLPLWSPDGTNLAHVGGFDGEEGIFVRNSATGDLLEASEPIFGIETMYWSPLGRYISFGTLDLGIGIYDIQTDIVTYLYEGGTNTLYDWSPDGSKVLYAHGSQMGQGLRLYDVNSTETQYLTEIYSTDATWSPDGQFVAFVRDTGDSSAGIFFVEVSSGLTISLLPDGTARSLNWSPTDNQIAFASASGIQTVNFDTAQITQISTTPSDDFPVWSPDGAALLFSSNMEAQFPTLTIASTTGTSAAVQVGGGQQRVDTTAHVGMWFCEEGIATASSPTLVPTTPTAIPPSPTLRPTSSPAPTAIATVVPTRAVATPAPIIGTVGVPDSSVPAPAPAGPSVVPSSWITIDVPAIPQRFSPGEQTAVGWDDGSYNCLLASLAMTLTSLQQRGLVPSEANVSYEHIRRTVWSQAGYGSPLSGASNKLVQDLTPSFTMGAITSQPSYVPPSEWVKEVRRQLRSGFPVIAYTPDWQRLAGGWTGVQPHSFVIIGISNDAVRYIEPWDGKVYQMTIPGFERALDTRPNYDGNFFFHILSKQ